MAKRKCGVNDIIYELDNDDTLSSEDEVKEPKIIRIGENRNPNGIQKDSNTQGKAIEIIDVDSSVERINDPLTPEGIQNGGKSPIEFIVVDEVSETASPRMSPSKLNKDKKYNNSDIVFEEDIIVDSPASNSDLGVVGCENRTPLVTVKFRDSKLAMNYKKQIKAFMLNLIKLHGSALETDNETDLELDIWPEDLEDFEEPEKPADDLFFVDTDPNDDMPVEIPSYSQNASLITHTLVKEPTPPPMLRRKGPICFNCNGNHTMRECKEPLNNARVAENRKAMVKKGRYHVEDEQKYGHLIPGRISGQLRHALGLKRHELPLHIYRMRHLGYPPGWLEEARISHSGITLFDSSGQATLDPEDEEGELVEPGCKDKYDIKKIHDFPGFNVPASSRYKEEAHALGLPPMSDADSKMSMLTVLAPNAMQAYKRKKLALFPARPGDAAGAAAEMDIDSGDEALDFPSQPPLPDDAPPPPPPPPDVPPPPDSPPPLPPPPPPEDFTPQQNPTTKTDEETNSKEASNKTNTDSDDDLQVVEVMKVQDIPIPKMDIITIDVDGDVSEPESGLPSPSLDDLEQKKRLLLDALDTDKPTEDKTDVTQHHDNKTGDVGDKDEAMIIEPVETTDVDIEDRSRTAEGTSVVEVVDEKVNSSNGKSKETVDTKPAGTDPIIDENVDSGKSNVDNLASEKANVKNVVSEKLSSGAKSNDCEVPSTTDSIPDTIKPTNVIASSLESTPKSNEVKSTELDVPKTPTSSMGLVRGTEYGTPVINVASPYVKLPSDDKFAKDICDVINFENLPNSIGKYKKISTLLKKVKSEVDRIQES